MTKIIAVLLVAMVSLPTFAQQTVFRQSAPVIPIMPEPGGFFDATQPGNGIMVEVADDGFVFGAFFYYDALGMTKWATVQGFCAPVSEQVRMTSDVVCRVTPASMFEARNGQCWGCPWRPNSTFTSTDMNSGVEVVFFAPNRGELRANGSILPLRRLSEVYPGQTARDRLLGQWDRSRYRMAKDCSTCAEYVVTQRIGAVEVRPITTRKNFLNVARPAGFENPSVDALPVFPSNDVPQYEIVCRDSGGASVGCINLFSAVGDVAFGELFYEEQGSGAIRQASLCTNRNLPDCEVVEGQIGSIVIRNSIGGRKDVYVAKNRLIIRSSTKVGSEFVIQEEEVWTKRDGVQTIPITTTWPF